MQGLLKQQGQPAQPPMAEPAPEAGQQMPPQQDQGQDADVQQFKRGLGAIAEVIYKNDQTANGILKMLPDGADQKQAIGGLTRAALTVLSEVDKQVNLPTETIIALVPQVVERIGEMGQAAGKFELTLDIGKRALAATMEGVIKIYGERIIEEQLAKPGMKEQVEMLKDPELRKQMAPMIEDPSQQEKANQYKELMQ